MNVIKFNKENYEVIWQALNQELYAVQNAGGLNSALESLGLQQFDKGFIQDDLQSVIKYRISHPDNSSRGFAIQFNKKRALRHVGAGRKHPPPNTHSINKGCFLCKENIRWQQRGIEIGYDINLGNRNYIAWMNPFPLMPYHVTIASDQHRPQSWIGEDDQESRSRVESITNDFLTLLRLLPGYIGFYNGEGAGASIPHHFHYQFFRRPAGLELFPLEKAAEHALHEINRPRVTQPIFIRHYPITAIYFHGEYDQIVRQVSSWTKGWEELYEDKTSLSANIIGSLDSEQPTKYHLYFIPRNKYFSHAPGMVGMIGGLEVLGELVFSTEVEKQHLDTGLVDFKYIERLLGAVEAPGARQLLDVMLQNQ